MLMNHQVWKDVERAADWGGLIIWGPTLSTASFLMKKTESYVPSTQPLEAGTHILLCVCVCVCFCFPFLVMPWKLNILLLPKCFQQKSPYFFLDSYQKRN